MLAYKSYLSIIQQDPKQLPDLIDDGTWREAALARNPCLYRWLNDGQLPAIMKEFGLPETLPMIERRSRGDPGAMARTAARAEAYRFQQFDSALRASGR